MYKLYLKRLFDIIISFISLLAFLPIIIISTIVLKLVNKGDAFFLQTRPGFNEKPFNIIKFKTMRDDKSPDGTLLSDNERMTTAGKWLRKLSIDELPQLINVLKGDMSLVGPRPLLFKYIPLYSINQRRRHIVKPGITGLAQVSGRNSISWTKKFELDVYYVDNVSFLLDFKILFLTVIKVFKSEGINQSLDRPMQPFDGTN